ncbi:Fic family protein [Rheinheimera sp. 1928-s]|uniref:Fic family protein n=1 Tax=Rheinheimera sp. 1928-s TaxID=3033803 RepID=UPI002638159F|nr:Fic family protein [Rheinheimera sp. 1928-s]MDF3127057.1 Fic family protein [Rheinheimera sp. 1928-s]
MDRYQTFYQPNPEILELIQHIEQQLAQWSVFLTSLSLQQRLELQNKALQASLALDHNSLSLLQLQELAAGKRVVALVQDIQQAQNALALYQRLEQFNPYQSADLRKAHAAFMSSVSTDAGHYRKQGAGVYEGHKLVHMPPAPAKVSALVDELLGKLQHEQAHPLLIACLMHYQLAFIHPFSDGNGRLCRLWQHLVLTQWQPCFAYLPFTAVLKDKSRDYQKALRQSVPKYDATAFILFILRSIDETLNTELQQLELTSSMHQTANLPDQPLVDLSQFVQLQTQKVKTKTPGPWYKTEDQILKKLKKDNRLSAKTIADELGLSSRAIEKQLAKLKAEGKLLRTGPAKGGRWQVVA